jgi:hypothetical protein
MPVQRFKVSILGSPIKMVVDELLAAEATVTFLVESDPAFQSRWTMARTLRNEPLLCAMRLQRVGSVQVSVSDPWLKQHVSNLRNDLIVLALQQLETYPPISKGAAESTLV